MGAVRVAATVLPNYHLFEQQQFFFPPTDVVLFFPTLPKSFPLTCKVQFMRQSSFSRSAITFVVSGSFIDEKRRLLFLKLSRAAVAAGSSDADAAMQNFSWHDITSFSTLPGALPLIDYLRLFCFHSPLNRLTPDCACQIKRYDWKIEIIEVLK